MLNVLKQSGAKATDSFKKHFNRSIVRLTFLYAGTLVIILIVSGIVLYSEFSSKIEKRFGGFPIPPPGTTREVFIISQPFPSNRPTAEEVQEDLIASLILVNGFLLILSGVSSYWLARRTLQPIKDAYERQQRFLSDASHELRTPLSILQIELENELIDLKKESLREPVLSKLEEVKRMSKIVNDLLTLSRLDEDAPHTKRDPQRVSLQKIILNITERLQSLAQSHLVTLSALPEKNPDVSIVFDQDLFSHALTNFIQNGIIYNKPQGTVDIATTVGDKEVCITITDSGIGISSDDLKNIFERFYRTDKSRSRQTGGTGLGLSIAHSAIEQMKGTLHIESEIGKSTTVFITLPLV
jgi:two-component system, OmpR family, sensor histidine kinase CiaH